MHIFPDDVVMGITWVREGNSSKEIRNDEVMMHNDFVDVVTTFLCFIKNIWDGVDVSPNPVHCLWCFMHVGILLLNLFFFYVFKCHAMMNVPKWGIMKDP